MVAVPVGIHRAPRLPICPVGGPQKVVHGCGPTMHRGREIGAQAKVRFIAIHECREIPCRFSRGLLGIGECEGFGRRRRDPIVGCSARQRPSR